MRTDRRRAIHIGVLVGMSTAAYAAALAGVATLQSAADRAAIAASGPVGRAASDVSAGHDVLESTLVDAADRYTEIADRYARLEPAIGDLEGTLDDLAIVTQRITDSAAQLPTRVPLPGVRVAPAAAPVPRTHAVTGASGG
jgi:hypothetical protein